jgi:hypoxanthine phosphoribosyltransferase
MTMAPSEARQILAEADVICTAEQVQAAIDLLATDIGRTLANDNPLVLTVMGGGVVFAGQLLPRLRFPLECDYLHVTRYGAATAGGALTWVVEPRASVKGKVVLVLDDILDEGVTLAAIKARLLDQGAARCLVAVLTQKELGRPKPIVADFIGLRLPNRYVFGCGMDVKGAWRNLPAIYAVKGL